MAVVLRYSLLRLTLLVAVAVVMYAVGARGLVWLLLTAVVSIGLSYVVLRGPREQMAQALVQRQQQRAAGGRRSRLDEDAAAEDAAADAQRRRGGGAPR
ncbi:DUF4229 domain-containing protein [Pseudokineococcus sp. 1T1Z-3]|uniref:DUF4229 domain-containing protein n=1 Tax=Pseudokineococcus sp. 1T1Z-3 TaxID=3132745 RepID=UPI0030A81098